MRDFNILPSFSSVGAGQTATIDLPTVGIYHQLRLNYVTDTAGGATLANMIAEIGQMRLKVNGVVQRQITGAELFSINAYHGNAAVAGVIPFYFSEHWRRSPGGEDSLAWGMADVDSFQLEVDIINNAAQTCSLSATAVKELGNRLMGPIVKMRRYSVTVAATGIVNVQSLPRTDAYYALHAFSANIADVRVRMDQRDRFEAVLADVNDYYTTQGKVPQASMFHIDASATGRVADAFNMRGPDGKTVSEFQVDFNMTSAASFALVTEQLGLRD